MKNTKKILGLVLALIVLTLAMSISIFAQDSENTMLPDGITAESFGDNTVTDGTNFYATLSDAVIAIDNAKISGAILYCKPNANVGSLQHAPVCSTLTVYGNGATVAAGGNQDFDIGNTDPNGGRDVTADMTLTVYNLNGCGAWGAKATEHTVTVVFEGCKDMGEVFINGTVGTLNISLTNCSFTSNVVSNCKVYSNANGNITLNGVEFSNVDKAVNLNHKVAGTQEVVLTNCTFTNCGNNVTAGTDEIPVRVLSSVEGGNSNLTVSGCEFTGTPEGGADILLDYGVGSTNASVSSTSANVTLEKEKNVGSTTVVASTDNKSFSNVEVAYVATVNGVGYESFADALAAAKAMTGDVVVEILDKVTLNTHLIGNYNSIKFVGKTETAEIYLDLQGYSEATGEKVAFEDLKLSKVAGGYIANAGFMNLAFGVFNPVEVTYTNCTFLNGAYASYGEAVFTGCTFYRSHDRYGLWVYDQIDVTVDGCTFADIRGIKMYSEGKFPEANLTVKNTDFSAVDGKPAIVLTHGNSVTLENNTYNPNKGVFELDLDGNPNGVTVTSDVYPTCVNDNGACGVLVNGKIYTTVAQAAEVAVAGSSVILLHNSTETVELAEGVILDKNNFEAAGVTVKVSLVADVDGVQYSSLEEAFANANTNSVIKLLSDIEGDITVPANVVFNGNGFAVSGTLTAGGNITFTGITKAGLFAIQYVNTTVTIEKDASLQLTSTGRITVGYGCTFNIEGNVADAKTANKADVVPSFVVPGGLSITGSTGVTFNVKNAYVSFGNTSSKNSAANGTFNMSFENSIVEFTNQFTLATPKYDTLNPVFNVTFTDSVVTTATKMCLAAPGSNVVVDNSSVTLGTYFHNSGNIEITNGSTFVGSMIQYGENGGNSGTITVDNASLTIKNANKAYAMDGNNTGKLILTNGAVAAIDYITETAVTLGVGSTITCKSDDLTVETDPAYEVKYENGEYVTVKAPVAKIGDVKYSTLKEAIANVKEGETIEILGEVSEGSIKLPAGLKNVTFKGANGATLKDMTVNSPDGGAYALTNITFDGIVFENSIIVFTGMRNADCAVSNLTITNCTFKNIVKTGNYAAVHFNFKATEPVNGFTFTNNVIDGISGSSNCGITGNCVSGNIVIENNVFNSVTFYPFNFQIVTNDGVNDKLTVNGNTFSGSSKGRLQALSKTSGGTDAVEIVTNYNIIKDVTDTFQICYYNFNAETTTADLSNNYYGIDIEANPGLIYFNNAASDVDALKEMGIFPIYKELNEDGSINLDSAYTPPSYVAEVNGVGYETLGEAIAALKDGETLVILESFTAGANEFIELNGKKNVTITAAEGVVINGNISIGYHESHTDNNVDRSTSTLTVNGLTVNGTLTVISNDANCVVSNSTAAQFTIKPAREGMNFSLNGNTADGSIGTATNGYGVFVVPHATAYNLAFGGNTLKNVSGHAITIQGCGEGSAVTYANSISFTNNTFESWGLSGKSNRAAIKIWADTKYAPAEGGEVTEAMKELVWAVTDEAAGNKFNSTASNTVEFDAYGVAGDGEEIAPAVTYVAEVNGVKYADIQEAFKAATSGCTITILEDITIDYAWDNRYTGAKFTVPVTIDGNGKTIKFTNTVYDAANYMSAFRFEADAVVTDLTIDMSEALSGFATRIRAISAKANLTVDNCTFIGNGATNNTRAIIFGEGATSITSINIINSNFSEWRQGVMDNESGKDVAVNVTITGNTFENAGVNVSATTSIVFNNNTVSGAYVKLVSYTENNTLNVTATGNTLVANADESSNCNFTNAEGEVNVQDDFVVPVTYVAEVNGVQYATLAEAFAAVTSDNDTVTLLCDVTEELLGAYIRGNIVTKDGAKVTITLTNSDWVYLPYTFVIGENVTLKAPYLFYYAGGGTINGTVITDAYYQRYAGTKLTINEPGSMTVNTEMFYLRFTDGDSNAGIYINGDNNDETIGLKLSVAYFYQGMISAKDANIQVAVYWQTNETDGQGSANLVLDNSTLTVTGVDFNMIASGNSTVTVKNGSTITVRGMEVGAGSTLTVNGGKILSNITNNGTVDITSGSFSMNPSAFVKENQSIIKDFNNLYVVGVKPTASVENLGSTVVNGGNYTVYNKYGNAFTTSNAADMPLSFIMQYVANESAQAGKDSPYADWYADFVITVTGLDNPFVAEGCYLAGYYGSFGWVKIPIDSLTIANGVRYPVMLATIGNGQKYEYICESVQNFKCALYLTPEVLAANPNLEVNLELCVIDNSAGGAAAQNALATPNSEYTFKSAENEFVAEEFKMSVAKVGDKKFTTLKEAVDYAIANGGTVELICNVELTEAITIPAGATVTLDLNGNDITAPINVIINNGTLTINDTVGNGNVYTTDVSAQGRATIVNYGTITINGGWYGDSNNDTTDRNAINRGNAIKNSGTAVINGGYFTNVSNQFISTDAYAYAINTLSGGTTTINNATVYGDINGLIFSDGNTVVNDGSFTLGRPNEENNLWYLAYGNVEIKGGTWVRAFKVPSWNTSYTTFTGNVAITGGSYAQAPEKLPEGYTAIKNFDGLYVVGVKPTADVENLGSTVVNGGNYTVYNKYGNALTTSNAADMPLSFIMQYVANESAQAGKDSPYADWYADFVITVTGLDNPFVAEGCYLAGYYGSFGWVKIPIDSLTIANDVRYPVMLATIGNGQKYEYICESVQNFKCALYLTPEVLAANPNLQVNLELCVIDNSAGGAAAQNALATPNSEYTFKSAENDFTKEEFVVNYVAQVGEKKFVSLQDAINYVSANGGEVKLLNDVELTETLVINGNVTLDLAGFDITMTLASVNGTTFAIKNNGTFTITNSTTEVGEICLTYTGERNSNASISTIGNYGTLNIEGGKINCVAGNQAIAYAIDTFTVTNEDIFVNISGGEVCGGASGYCIRMFLCSTTNNNELNVTGGNVGYVWAQNTNANANKATINVTGGNVAYIYVAPAGSGTFDVSNVTLNVNADCTEYAPYVGISGDEYALRNVDGVYMVVKCNYVAQVGETKYESLAEAIAAAQNGDTITLLADIVDAGVISIKAGVTLDGNNKTISGNSCVYVATAGTTVIKNVNFKDISNDSNNLSAIYATGLTSDANVTITGCTFENIDWDSIQITSLDDVQPTVVITNNIFKEDTDTTTLQTRHIHIELGATTRSKINLTVDMNKFYGNTKQGIVSIYYVDPNGSNVNIGKNYVEYPNRVSIVYSTAETGSYNANEEFLPLYDEALENEIKYVAMSIFNKYNVKYYTSLQEAIAAANAGETIKLLANIELTETITILTNVTIDLNGKTVTGADGAIVFNVKADTTIKNGTIKGNKSGTSSGLIDIYANLTMDGVTVETSKILALRFKAGELTATLTNCNVTGAFKGYGYSVWNIVSGTYKASSTAISEQLNGTAAVSGGTFYYEIKETVCAPGYGVVVNEDGTYTVKYAPVGFVDANNNGTLDEGEYVFANLDQVFATYKSGDVYIVLTSNAVAKAQVDTDAKANYYINASENVTVDFLFADDWNYIQKMTIGENITLNAKYLLAWTELNIAGTINAEYLYITVANVTVNEGAVVNVATGEATVQVKNGATLTVNGTVNTAILNVWVGDSKLIVSGTNAKVDAKWVDIWDGTPSVTVENGATLEVESIKASRGGEITVDNATLVAETIELGHNAESAGKLVEIGDSTISTIELTDVGSTVTSDGGLDVITNIADHKVVFENNEYKVVPCEYVAEVNGVKYESLAEAIAVGGEVKLLANITLTETVTVTGTVTLDLNGYVISGTCNSAQSTLVYIENGATFTLKDTSDAQTGKITYAQGSSNVGWTIDVKGTFVLESGTIELTGSWSIGYAVDVRPNSWGNEYKQGTSFVMNGGKIISSDGGVRVASSSSDKHTYVSASFEMNGGLIDAAWDGVFVQQSNTVYDKLSVTVNGGTIESDLNPIRVYGPAPTDYVDGTNCMNITLAGGTLTYTGTETREWVIENILRVGGGNSVETIVANGSVVVSSAIAQSVAAPDGYKWSANEDGTYTLAECNYVAQVGDTKYETLAEAIANANGSTVILLANVELTEAVVISTDVTIDLATFEVSLNSTTVNCVFNIENGTVAISNGTITTNNGQAIYAGLNNDTTYAPVVTLENVTLNGADFGLSVFGGANVTIGNLVVINGSVEALRVWNNASVTVNTGATINCTGNGEVARAIAVYENGNVSVVNGTVNGIIEAIGGTLVVTGGTFSQDVNEYCADGYICVADGNVYIVKEGKFVAQVGETKYESLEEAIENANGEVVTLLAPIVVNKGETLTIDLKGATVVYSVETANKSVAMITNKGTLTINDSVGNGKLSFTYEGASFGYGVGMYTISNEGGTLNVNGGTIENLTTVSGSMYDAIDNNSTLGDTVVNINGGSVYCSYLAIRQFANSTTYKNTVNVTGGTIEGGNSSIWTQNPGSSQPNANIEVSNGTFIGRILLGESSGFTTSFTGGKFTTDVSEHCADGFYCVDNGDGTYELKEIELPEILDFETALVLGSDFKMSFYMPTKYFVEGVNYYAMITKHHADGCGTEDVIVYVTVDTTTVYQSTWHGECYRVVAENIAAREMNCEISCKIFAGEIPVDGAENTGVAVSGTATDSVVTYAKWMLDNTTDEALKTLIVDMLNYGAAAQVQFKHYTDTLANRFLSDEQKASSVLPSDYVYQDITTMFGTNVDDFAGTFSSITLESTIYMNFYLANMDKLDNPTVVVSFAHHTGTVHQIVYTVGDEEHPIVVDENGYAKIVVDDLAPADAKIIVSCEVYNGEVSEENLLVTIQDSIESYCGYYAQYADEASLKDVCEKIVKYSQSAYEYFHKKIN